MTPTDPLAGLEAVPWADLTHAYGPASDVPGHLTALTSAEAPSRAEAWRQLDASIFHQGRVFPATSRAIPFLVRLAQWPQVLERTKILEFLKNLSGGRIESGPGMPNYEAELAAWHAVQDALHSAVSAFADLLSDQDPAIRASAAVALGVSATRSEELLEVVFKRMGQESDVKVLACEILVLPRLGGAPRLASYLLHPSKLVQFAAAITTCRSSGERSEEAITILRNALRDPTPIEDHDLPWGSMGVRSDACLGLCGLGDGMPDDQFAEILEAFQALPDSCAAATVGLELLRLTVGETTHACWDAPKSAPFGQLTERQRATLTAFARSSAVWDTIETRMVLLAHGLPMDQESMRRFVSQ